MLGVTGSRMVLGLHGQEIVWERIQAKAQTTPALRVAHQGDGKDGQRADGGGGAVTPGGS